MADRISAVSRSALMSRIRSKDTRPELLVRRMLHGLGYRYLLHDKRLPGHPDLVFPARRKVIFVHGCFWHGHACGRGFKPAANADVWAQKIERNRLRDRRQSRALRRQGWQLATVWECALKPARLASTQARLVAFLQP